MIEEIDREPVRPSQRETAITESLTGVRLDLELCGVCSQTRGVGDHHIRFRSHGGKGGGTIPLCVRCHEKVHGGDWKMERLENGIQIVDREGQVIWRLLRWPFEGSAGDFVQLLDRVGEVEKLMPEIASALLPYQAVQVFEALRAVGEGGWRAQMRLIGEFYQYRLPGCSAPEKVLALCQLFGIRRSQVYNHIMLAERFPAELGVLEETPLGMGYALEAARSTEPTKWLGFAEERKLSYPQFSRDDLRKEIIRAGGRTQIIEAAKPAADQFTWAECMQCGVAGWQRRLPVGNEGTAGKAGLLQWAVGLFDGEGCVTVLVDKGKGTYQLMLALANTNKKAVEDFRDLFGGSLYCRQRDDRKPIWDWRVYGTAAQRIAEQLFPQAKIKRRVLRLALAFPIHDRPGLPRTDEVKRGQARVAALVHRHNTQGNRVPVAWARCPECKHIGWLEKLPIGSTGEPLEVGEEAK